MKESSHWSERHVAKTALLSLALLGGCSSSNSPGTSSGASGGSSNTSGGAQTGGASAITTVGGAAAEMGGATSGGMATAAGGAATAAGGTAAGAPSTMGGAAPDGTETGGAATAMGGDMSGVSGAGGALTSGGGTSAGSGGMSPNTAMVDAWYEAETIPPNVLTNGAASIKCNSGGQYNEPTCTHDQLKEGMSCCSEGGLVVSLLGRAANNAGSGVEFHNVMVPADGMYAVTWWFHCGASDVFGDTTCGGLHYAVPSGIGCRPHIIDVNGVTVKGGPAGDAQFYQFPCYSTPWSIVHAANTTLPLKAGANVIYIHPPHVANLDSADIDAIHVTAVGQGTGLTVTPVVGNGAN